MSRLILRFQTRTPPQKRISESKSRFNIGIFGRQSGKTTFGIEKMVWKPMLGPKNSTYWYILQTHNAAEIAFNRYLQLGGIRSILAGRPNHSEKKVILEGNRQIFFKSGQNYEDLRAETLHGVIVDEMRQQHKDLWPMIVRPMVARHKGWADFLSTPNGFDHTYDLYQFAKENTEEWSTFHAPSTESFWWNPEEIASAKANMSDAVFAQEIMAEFRNLFQGQVYVCFGEWNERTENPFCTVGHFGNQLSTHLPITLALDFNINPMSWALGQFRGKASYWFDEIYIENSNTQETTKVLIEKIKTIWSSGHQNKTIQMIGDSAGNQRATQAAGATDYNIIEQMLTDAGISFTNETPASNPQIKDRVNSMNAVLRNAQGDTFFWLNPNTCKYLKKDLQRVTWKGGNSAVIDKTSDQSLSHMSDAVGYPVSMLAGIDGVGKVGELRVIQR